MSLSPFEIVQVVYMTLTVIFAVYAFFSRATDKDEHRLSVIETRVAVLEEARKTAIVKEDLKDLYDKLNKLSAEVHHLSGEFNAVKIALNRLYQNALDKTK